MSSWWQVDPFSEESRRISPYVYGNNNPIRFTDPDGRMTEDEVMRWYTSHEISNFGDRTSGNLDQSINYGESAPQTENLGTDDQQNNQTQKGVEASVSGEDPYNLQDPINDPLIAVKAMTGFCMS